MDQNKESQLSMLRQVIKTKKLLLEVPFEQDGRAFQTRAFMNDLLNDKLEGTRIIGVTGASGAGKDEFVETMVDHIRNSQSERSVHHLRFGDYMKDLAYQLGMTPYSRKACEEDRSLRFKELPNGKNSIDAWIALDVIREYNPYIFIEKTLESFPFCNHFPASYNPGDLLIFSGMRTEAGLRVVSELADKMIRVERFGHTPPEAAVLDELQILWPVDEVILNNGTLEDWKYKAKEFLYKFTLS